MSIDIKDVEKIAELAKLQFTEEEKTILSKDLNKVLDYIDKINTLDKELSDENVRPMAHVLEIENDFHKDSVQKSLFIKESFKFTPKSKNGYIVVPKII